MANTARYIEQVKAVASDLLGTQEEVSASLICSELRQRYREVGYISTVSLKRVIYNCMIDLGYKRRLIGRNAYWSKVQLESTKIGYGPKGRKSKTPREHLTSIFYTHRDKVFTTSDAVQVLLDLNDIQKDTATVYARKALASAAEQPEIVIGGKRYKLRKGSRRAWKPAQWKFDHVT